MVYQYLLPVVFQFYMNIQWMYIVGKYKFISETLETGRKASLYNFFLVYSAESANKKDFKGHFIVWVRLIIDCDTEMYCSFTLLCVKAYSWIISHVHPLSFTLLCVQAYNWIISHVHPLFFTVLCIQAYSWIISHVHPLSFTLLCVQAYNWIISCSSSLLYCIVYPSVQLDNFSCSPSLYKPTFDKSQTKLDVTQYKKKISSISNHLLSLFFCKSIMLRENNYVFNWVRLCWLQKEIMNVLPFISFSPVLRWANSYYSIVLFYDINPARNVQSAAMEMHVLWSNKCTRFYYLL